MKRILTSLLLGVATMAQAEYRMSLFELTVKPEQQQAIDAVGKHNLGTSIQTEAGTLAMFHTVKKDEPSQNVILEIYRDEAAYQAHTNASHFKQFVEIAKTAVVGRKVVPLDLQILLEKQPLTAFENSDYLINLAEVSVKPVQNEDFKAIVLDEMQQSMTKENSVILMYAATLKDQPNEWRFFEIYANKTAYQQHRNTPHFQAYLKQTQAMIERKNVTALVGKTLASKGLFK
ncbi:antibiotic biosynthesis monooxygenase [Actinobacillus equuli subsp. haemolyticus]|uniref:putative quinol monooxygenase n=1 Tax=Actinobacillus equuli TaxID=718 RepID=UPI0024434671|nr:antibiotic biosynthesis monooxygenase [Actinobacillus equuli]WGE71188.1 antibiotic biosynthesis monooxygenase [Actinobacillus equuli subsp. haemolyticus]WGE81538.1 antibiotic biosynthesis monooxygenase [Actinobacillus equuli subsp. haemolyticus]